MKVAPRLNRITGEFIASHFDTLNSGCEFTLETLPVLYRRTIQEIKGRFTASELALLLSVSENVTMVSAGVGQLAGQHIALAVSDSFSLYPGKLESDYGVECQHVLNKLAGLTAFQLICLEIWLAKYWRDKADLNDYINQLI